MGFSQRHQLNALRPDSVYVLHVEDKDFHMGLEKLFARAVKPYGVPEERIVWITARNKVEACEWLDHVAALRPPVRGFDAVICDIKLPGEDGKLGYFGLEVAAQVAKYQWPCAVIGLSAFARDDIVLTHKGLLENLNENIFNDFLSKDELIDEDFVVAKLARCVVPTAKFVELAKRWEQPAFFHGAHMWRIFRELIGIAFSPVADRLPKILLLGEPGTGKGMLARAYHQLLLERDRLEPSSSQRRELQTVNCATLVASGEGGRVRLFGYKGSRNATLHSAPGVFELTTCIAADKAGFAAASDKPNYAAGGVAFLDEFIEMNRDLQAAVLNALEDGVVYRQDGSRVTIGCHVVFATNASAEELVGRSNHHSHHHNHNGVRSDLLDRITHVLTVPPLRDRIDEVGDLVISFARARLKAHGGDEAIQQPVEMAASAERLLRRAIELKLLNSVRQLQIIADVRPGERIITDGNLRWVMEKTRLLGIPGRRLIDDAPERAVAQISWEPGDVMGLAGELRQTFQVLRGTEKQPLIAWIDGRAEYLSDASKKRIAADERTWQRALLRVLCDLGDDGLRRMDVFDLKRDGLKGEKMWTVVVDKLVGGKRSLRELFRAQFKEQSRAVLDRMGNALVVLSAGVWDWSFDEQEVPAREDMHAAGEIARAVYPEPKEALPTLYGVLEAGEGTPRLRVAMARVISKHASEPTRTEALLEVILARAHTGNGPDTAYETAALSKLLASVQSQSVRA